MAVGPLKTIVARHTSRFGHLALLAPILAACTVTIILIFRDQTLIGEIQASSFKSAVRREGSSGDTALAPLRARFAAALVDLNQALPAIEEAYAGTVKPLEAGAGEGDAH